jgi:aspartyl-tRNA(Asn)/glutamyl-tRNA(Gln) amidotransferase subunit B
MKWEIVIGLETHAQLSTASKMFSGASTAFGAAPNTQASAVDIALPGVLPVANRGAIERAIRFGLAVGGEKVISRRSVFARKNYFYPDLPKGYQISQYELPIVVGGEIPIISPTRGEIRIRLTRAHLEEDAGKSLHEDFRDMSGIDLNRAGVPLLEIVSEPEMRSAQEAVVYAQKLRSLVVHYKICDGNMQEGSFRCDANVSVRRPGGPLGTRCEIKNLNSFRFMERAIEFEAKRQIEILEDGGKIVQETRLYDPDKNETRSMRTKEEAHDYRYFPDPDLLPLVISEEEIKRIHASMPDSLETTLKTIRTRLVANGLPDHIAQVLTASLTGRTKIVDEANAVISKSNLSPEKRAEFLRNVGNAVNSSSNVRLDTWEPTRSDKNLPGELVKIQKFVDDGIISSRQAKEVQEGVEAGEGTAEGIIQKRGLSQISDVSAIEKIIDQVLAANAKQVEDYRAGKEKAFNSLVGQVMKATQGKANPAQVNEILKRKLAG